MTEKSRATRPRRERLRWISDNKKAEWRELIDELDKSLIAMGHAFSTVNVVSASDPWNDPMAGIGKGNRIIHDRIFIADALKKHGVLAKWEELVRYTSDASNPREPSQQGEPTPVGFSLKANAFQDELLRIARKDLGL
jgi:hypothetical protein